MYSPLLLSKPIWISDEKQNLKAKRAFVNLNATWGFLYDKELHATLKMSSGLT